MPTLPTFDVSTATATRLLKAFEGQKDDETGAPLTSQQAYKRWLKRNLMEYVTHKENMASQATLSSELTT
jgi:hypothetical protein